MAGYKSDFSKSNNAAKAEGEGKFPVSVVSKKTKIPTDLIRAHIVPCEWHHSSSYYNEVDYYSLDDVEEFFASEVGKSLLFEYKSRKKTEEVHLNCKVEWLEWSGSRRSPKCEQMQAEGATVVVRGKTAYITLANGEKFQKRLSTNGFKFDSEEQVRARDKDVAFFRKKMQSQKIAYKKEFLEYAKGKKVFIMDWFAYKNGERSFKRARKTDVAKHIADSYSPCDESNPEGDYARRTLSRLKSGNDVVRVGIPYAICCEDI